MKTQFKIGNRVMVCPENDNENYNNFKNDVLIVTHVATNSDEHPGFDDGLKGSALYDLKTEDGTEIPCSLYDYELIPA